MFKDFLNTKCKTSRSKIYEYIWNKYNKRLLYFIKNNSNQSPEDLLSEIMIKIFENIDKYDPEYSLSTWVYTITKNHLINDYKKKKPILIHDFDNSDIETSVSDNSFDEKAAQVENILKDFSPEMKEIIFLRYYEKQSYNNISKILNIKKGTVKSRLHYAKKILKENLEKNNEF